MSWYVSGTNIPVGEIKDIELLSHGGPQEETQRAFEYLRAAAQLVAESGILGKAKLVHVSINGHANPGNKTQTGFVNDCGGFSISVAEYEEEPVNALTNDDPHPEEA